MFNFVKWLRVNLYRNAFWGLVERRASEAIGPTTKIARRSLNLLDKTIACVFS